MTGLLPRRVAVEAGEAFRDALASVFVSDDGGKRQVFERWEVAGSARRMRPEVKDLEVVVVPAVGPDPNDPGGLFGTGGAGVPRVNLLWSALDELERRGVVRRQVKADGRTRWGDRHRAALFSHTHRGREVVVPVELFTATRETWGYVLAIRTGPADLSRVLVSMVAERGCLECRDGAVRYRGGASAGEVYPTPDEAAFFRVAGSPMALPHLRDDLLARHGIARRGKPSAAEGAARVRQSEDAA